MLSFRFLVVAGFVCLAFAAAVVHFQSSTAENSEGTSSVASPAASGDAHEIDLSLAPEAVEFEGFVNYGSPITQTVTDTEGNTHQVHLKD